MFLRSIVLSTLLFTLGLGAAACSSPTAASAVTAVAVSGTAPAVGATSQFAATATVGGAVQDVTSTATWTSSDPSIATVSSAGVVTGVASGSAVITATYSNISGADTITVP